MLLKLTLIVILLSSVLTADKCTQSNNVLSQDNIQKILAKHNELRQNVASGNEKPQPSAENMNELTWDEDMAKVAQNYANTCPSNLDSSVQLIWTGMTYSDQGDTDYTKAVESWYSEVKKFDPKGIDKYNFDYNTGTYTQMIWAKLEKVGCGINTWKGNGWFRHVLICKYTSGANMQGGQIYKQGPSAYACENKSKTYPSLCSATSSPPDTCTDNNWQCDGWKKLNYCKKESDYYPYMQATCKKSCDFCSPQLETYVKNDCFDVNVVNCKVWAKPFYCGNPKSTIYQNCKKSCGLC